MARGQRTRRVSAADARAFLAKAQEFLHAAQSCLDESRPTAAAGLAVHAGISAADAMTGARTGQRSAAADHAEAVGLLRTAGNEGREMAKALGRLLAMKNRAEYEPRAVSATQADRAVAGAEQIVAAATRAVAALS